MLDGGKLVIRPAIFCGIFMIRLKKCGEIGEFVGKSVTDLICSHEKVLNYICGSTSVH